MKQLTNDTGNAQRRGRLVTLTEQRWVKRPQSEVFHYVADFANSQEWDPGVARSTRLDDGPVGIGSKFQLDVEFGVTTIPMTYEITEYEPDVRVVLTGSGENIDAIDEIRFGTHDRMTVIDYRADLTINGIVKYLVPFMGRAFKKVGTRALDGMVKALDG